jgi:hypothetical protein
MTKRYILPCLLLGLLLPSLSSATPDDSATSATPQQSPTKLEQDERTQLLLIPASIDGKSCYLLLDTGATHTTLDRNFCKEELPNHPLQDVLLIGTTNVKTPPQLITLDRFEVAGKALPSPAAMVVDLSPLRKALSLPIAGILGMNHLGVAPFRLSVAERQFEWLSNSPVTSGFQEIPADLTNNKIRVTGKTDHGSLPMIVDSAASHTFVPAGLWPEGDQSSSYQVTTINGHKGDAPKFKQGQALDLKLNDALTLKQVVPNLYSDKKEALLGVDLLKSMDIIIDVPAQRLYANTRDHN